MARWEQFITQRRSIALGPFKGLYKGEVGNNNDEWRWSTECWKKPNPGHQHRYRNGWRGGKCSLSSAESSGPAAFPIRSGSRDPREN
jgi:hypothetical protein